MVTKSELLAAVQGRKPARSAWDRGVQAYKERKEKMNAKIKTTHAVYSDGNRNTLTPYVSDNGEIWLASEGSGCGNDVMINDITGWTDEEICEHWSDIDLDAMRADAEEIRSAGDADNADWIEDWCRTCERARKSVRYATVDARLDGTGDEFTAESVDLRREELG